MESLPPIAQYTAGVVALAVVVGFLMLHPTSFGRWLQKKNYQYEVTFALYMLTPTEKFIFNSILFLTLSMLTLACVVYLPDHLSTISRRAFYYFGGDAVPLADATRHAATGFAGAALNSVAAAQEVVSQAAENLGWVG